LVLKRHAPSHWQEVSRFINAPLLMAAELVRNLLLKQVEFGTEKTGQIAKNAKNVKNDTLNRK
jgi:hypothetical protein